MAQQFLLVEGGASPTLNYLDPNLGTNGEWVAFTPAPPFTGKSVWGGNGFIATVGDPFVTDIVSYGGSWFGSASFGAGLTIRGMFGLDPANIYVATGGALYHYDGTNPTVTQLFVTTGDPGTTGGVWAADVNNVFTGGGAGGQEHYGYWNGSTYTNRWTTVQADLFGVANPGFPTAVWGFSANEVYYITSQGLFIKWDGSNFFAYDATTDDFENVNTPSWNASNITSIGFVSGGNGMWGTSINNLWALGNNGTLGRINKFDGTQWINVYNMTTGTGNGNIPGKIWGISASEMVAMQAGSRAYHTTDSGVTWNPIDTDFPDGNAWVHAWDPGADPPDCLPIVQDGAGFNTSIQTGFVGSAMFVDGGRVIAATVDTFEELNMPWFAWNGQDLSQFLPLELNGNGYVNYDIDVHFFLGENWIRMKSQAPVVANNPGDQDRLGILPIKIVPPTDDYRIEAEILLVTESFAGFMARFERDPSAGWGGYYQAIGAGTTINDLGARRLAPSPTFANSIEVTGRKLDGTASFQENGLSTTGIKFSFGVYGSGITDDLNGDRVKLESRLVDRLVIEDASADRFTCRGRAALVASIGTDGGDIEVLFRNIRCYTI